MSLTLAAWRAAEVERLLGACPEDIDGSGSVDLGDLLIVLATWGPCEDCPGDLDGNGVVELDDLLAVLSAWGPCPE